MAFKGLFFFFFLVSFLLAAATRVSSDEAPYVKTPTAPAPVKTPTPVTTPTPVKAPTTPTTPVKGPVMAPTTPTTPVKGPVKAPTPYIKPPVTAPTTPTTPVKGPVKAPTPYIKPPVKAPVPSPYSAVLPPVDVSECPKLCGGRCSKHSKLDHCMRACGTCCMRCKCVPPGTYGNRERCGKCYAEMTTHMNRLKCP